MPIVPTGGLRTKGIAKRNVPGKPLISIITVSYNAEASIEETIKSVTSLSYQHIEYIIIDGGSTDDTVNIIKRYEDRIDYWISEKDHGIYDGMNKGVVLAEGEWINFLNCGDRFASAEALLFFERHHYDADILYGDALVEYPGFNTLFKKTPLKEMWKRMPICHQASFTRASLIKSWKFDLSYKLSSDFDFIYRAYLNNKKFLYVNQLICFFDFTTGASIKHVFRSVRERKQIVLKNSFSIKKLVYHSVSNGYIYLAFYFKRMIGVTLTNFITRLLSGHPAKADY